MRQIRTHGRAASNGKSLLVTVDVGMTKNYGYWRCPDGKDITPFEFFNDGRGFNLFWERVLRGCRENGLEEIVVGFESTGSYAEPMCAYLRLRGVKLVQINPMHAKKLKELEGNSPHKTDRKDPKVIADIIELGHALSLVVPEGPAAELRRLVHARERSMTRQTVLLNQAHSLLFAVFPEFLKVMKGIGSKTAREVLKRYPTPPKIAECDLGVLTKLMVSVSRGRMTGERAATLRESARDTVGVTEGRESITMELLALVNGLEETERFIAKLEAMMAVYLRQIPYQSSLLSIRGIGIVTAAGLVGEVGDFRKFKTIGEVMKLAGLNLYEVSSGAHKGRHHISKRGRPLLRKLLYYTALNTVRKNGVMHKTYQRHIAGGMVKNKALVAVARKLLGIIFALIRDQSLYQEDYLRQTALKTAA